MTAYLDSRAPVEVFPLPPVGALAAPRALKVLGFCNLLIGLVVPAVNYLLVSHSVDKIAGVGFSNTVTAPLWVTVWTFFVVGIVLIVAGLGLIAETLWGRLLSMFWVGLAFFGVLVGFVCMRVTIVLAEEEFFRRQFSQSVNIQFIGVAPLFLPMYAILLLVMMLLPPARNWARGVRAEKRGLPPEVAWAAVANQPPTYALAVVSMVLSMVPFLLITQIISVVMGIVSLRAIGKSEGRLGGRGYAWAGISISSVILLCCGSIIGFGLFAGLVLEPMEREQRKAREEERYRGKVESRKETDLATAGDSLQSDRLGRDSTPSAIQTGTVVVEVRQRFTLLTSDPRENANFLLQMPGPWLYVDGKQVRSWRKGYGEAIAEILNLPAGAHVIEMAFSTYGDKFPIEFFPQNMKLEGGEEKRLQFSWPYTQNPYPVPGIVTLSTTKYWDQYQDWSARADSKMLLFSNDSVVTALMATSESLRRNPPTRRAVRVELPERCGGPHELDGQQIALIADWLDYSYWGSWWPLTYALLVDEAKLGPDYQDFKRKYNTLKDRIDRHRDGINELRALARRLEQVAE